MITHYTTRISSIECDGCANSIRSSLGRLAGVEQVDVDVAEKTIAVDYESDLVSEEAINTRLTQAGFSPEQR